jgi:hypothetical protein
MGQQLTAESWFVPEMLLLARADQRRNVFVKGAEQQRKGNGRPSRRCFEFSVVI